MQRRKPYVAAEKEEEQNAETELQRAVRCGITYAVEVATYESVEGPDGEPCGPARRAAAGAQLLN